MSTQPFKQCLTTFKVLRSTFEIVSILWGIALTARSCSSTTTNSSTCFLGFCLFLFWGEESHLWLLHQHALGSFFFYFIYFFRSKLCHSCSAGRASIQWKCLEALQYPPAVPCLPLELRLGCSAEGSAAIALLLSSFVPRCCAASGQCASSQPHLLCRSDLIPHCIIFPSAWGLMINYLMSVKLSECYLRVFIIL